MSPMKNVKKTEIEHFAQYSDDWVQPYGRMRLLHWLNRVRVPFILNELASVGKIQNARSFDNLKVLDVGCGAGILTEAIGQLQAQVVGLDASAELITAAKINLNRFNNSIQTRITYVCETIEDHALKYANHYDVVVASEVIEHIIDKESFLDGCAKVLKPGGSIFVTTFNKTLLSFVLVKVFGEYILKVGPVGTHTWSMFVSPQRVQQILERSNCQTQRVRGMAYNFMKAKWSFWWCKWSSYALHMVKSDEVEKTKL